MPQWRVRVTWPHRFQFSSEKDRVLCKSEELQGEIDIHIKRYDGLQTEKENLLLKAESDIAKLHE